ncbi:hypothetical protein FB45DRAFT_1060930 [Roridomyces roridus]|uniref:Uncharacterized protein n=1 Tax=Roridomyces roridus TaxID=1738132 RepID=A0AAD7BLM3_9AGAR|nr:hypothetical protein FB45DRAFT_1060930 [Roridomyces roridus]
MDTNLLRNRNPNVRLGPFDGRVGCLTQVHGETYLVTTNAAYIPELPDISKNHVVYFHRDTRFGLDDPTLWPQQYSSFYCQLAAIPRRETCPELAPMWYTPIPDDHECVSSITRGIGRLSLARYVEVRDLFLPLRARVDRYLRSLPLHQSPHPLFVELNKSLEYGLTRLESLPLTFDQMCFTLTGVQRNFLELTALLDFLTIYKPRIDLLDAAEIYSVNEKCIGAFTTDPRIAQELFRAKLPFWFVRPLHLFANENILGVVPLTAPPSWLLQLQVTTQTDILGLKPIYTGASTTEKIHAMHALLRATSFYRDIFDSSESLGTSSMIPPTGSVRSSTISNRFAPYQAPAADGGATSLIGKKKKGGPKGPKKMDRDPYAPLQAQEMPDYIPVWSVALRCVDRTATTRPLKPGSRDKCFTLPEPALFASAEDPVRRCKFLHHWRHVRDAILYLLTLGKWTPLTNQQWRDILEGLIEPRGHVNSRTGKRSIGLAAILEPLIIAGHLDQSQLAVLPVPPENIPQYTINEFRRSIWEVAEINFRYELSALDRRASGQERFEDVRMCFPGGQLECVPLALATRGFASVSREDRLRYFIRLGTLMLDWGNTDVARPRFIDPERLGKPEEEFSEGEQRLLEDCVARYYTLSFYEYFGRAAVLPMRLSAGDLAGDEGN